MNIMLLLSGLVLVNKEIDKTPLENVTPIVEQYKIIPQEVIQLKIQENIQKELVAKKNTTKKKTTKKKTKKVAKKKVVKKAKKKVKKTVKKKTSRQKRTTKRVRYNVGEIQHYMNVLNAEYGWSNDDYIAWLMIVKRESSFNPNARNKKSGATGLCQALPARKMATHGKDYLTNYRTQARWCRDYIKNRYGTPQGAWAFWQKHHWF